MRLAVVDSDNVVVNVIEAPEDFRIDGYTLVASDAAGPGDTWDGTAFTLAPEPEPVATLRERYSRATTTTQRVSIIAEALGLTD